MSWLVVYVDAADEGAHISMRIVFVRMLPRFVQASRRVLRLHRSWWNRARDPRPVFAVTTTEVEGEGESVRRVHAGPEPEVDVVGRVGRDRQPSHRFRCELEEGSPDLELLVGADSLVDGQVDRRWRPVHTQHIGKVIVNVCQSVVRTWMGVYHQALEVALYCQDPVGESLLLPERLRRFLSAVRHGVPAF